MLDAWPECDQLREGVLVSRRVCKLWIYHALSLTLRIADISASNGVQMLRCKHDDGNYFPPHCIKMHQWRRRSDVRVPRNG